MPGAGESACSPAPRLRCVGFGTGPSAPGWSRRAVARGSCWELSQLDLRRGLLVRRAVARAILDYRWRRLPAARQAAADLGLGGALFPWQSGSDGREETPELLYNARSHRWMPGNSSRQRHVGLAVAYNAWQYYAATADLTWLAERGGELIIEAARLFASMARYHPDRDRFHVEEVMGPRD